MVLLLLGVVRKDLLDTWQASLPQDTPNHFLINIRSDQVEDFKRFFTSRGLGEPQMFPMIRARMTALNGTPSPSCRSRRPGEGLRRAGAEPELGRRPAGGQQDRCRPLVERVRPRPQARVGVHGLREELKLKVGDTLSFDVAGEPLEPRSPACARCSGTPSAPTSSWCSRPHAGRHGGHVAHALNLDEQGKRSLCSWCANSPACPSSTWSDPGPGAPGRRPRLAGRAVRVPVHAAAGITVLLAAVQSTRDERAYESAMLRTLGASRRVVLAGVATEFVALGMLSGCWPRSARRSRLVPRDRAVQPRVPARPDGVARGHRARDRDRRRRRHAGRAFGGQPAADHHVAAVGGVRPHSVPALGTEWGLPLLSRHGQSEPAHRHRSPRQVKPSMRIV